MFEHLITLRAISANVGETPSHCPVGRRMERFPAPVLLALLLTTGLFGCRYDEETEKQVLETGDTLLNETYMVKGKDTIRVNKYSLQFARTGETEFVAQVFGDDGLLRRNSNLKVVKEGERLALIVGRHVFKRWRRGDKPWWYAWAVGINRDVADYVRALSARDANLPDPFNDEGMFRRRLREFPYRVETCDLMNNILVASKTHPNPALPEHLVYSSKRYDFPWNFDPRRTHEMNPTLGHIPFPKDASIEFVVVTIPGRLLDADIELERRNDLGAALHLAGAKVAVNTVVDVNDKEPKTLTADVELPSGRRIARAYDVRGAWGDWDPNRASVFIQSERYTGPGWRLLRFGATERISAASWKDELEDSEDPGIPQTTVLDFVRLFRPGVANTPSVSRYTGEHK